MVLKLQEFYKKRISFQTHTPPPSLLFSYMKISLYTNCSVITFGNGKAAFQCCYFQ